MLATATDQATELSRVTARIAPLVLRFCRNRKRTAPQFRLAELTFFVGLHAQVAPDSPRRVLSHLRDRGLVQYRLVSRRESLYRVTRVKGGAS